MLTLIVRLKCHVILGQSAPPPERGKTLCPQTISWAHKIIFALLLVYVTGYRMLGELSTLNTFR